MKLFVNREPELTLIDESFKALLDRRLLVRTPIIEVQGVGGIGKTSLLKEVEQRCQKTQLPCVWVDVSQHTSNVEVEIISQVKRYIQASYNNATHAMKVLLKQRPAVMLFDAVDTAETTQLSLIENLLKDLIDDEKLFVVFASKKALTLQQYRSVARKLTIFQLKALDRKHCESYLDTLDTPIEPEVRTFIFEWTRGYPLAMNVLAQAVQNGLDPRTPEGLQKALALLTEQVIHQGVLATVNLVDRTRYFSTLQLFSVPRRFNLVIMQDLIETFIPEAKLESSIAYWGLPKEINEATDVLNWNMARAGFSVDEPLRTLFLLLLKAQHSERYFAIHQFLAQTNLRLAKEVPGFDRTRYIREALYHIASLTDSPSIEQQLLDALKIVKQEPPETLLQFSEEFSQDTELKEALGSHLTTLQTKISEYLPTSNTDTEKE
jgi:NB-ARC domain